MYCINVLLLVVVLVLLVLVLSSQQRTTHFESFSMRSGQWSLEEPSENDP